MLVARAARHTQSISLPLSVSRVTHPVFSPETPFETGYFAVFVMWTHVSAEISTGSLPVVHISLISKFPVAETQECISTRPAFSLVIISAFRRFWSCSTPDPELPTDNKIYSTYRKRYCVKMCPCPEICCGYIKTAPGIIT